MKISNNRAEADAREAQPIICKTRIATAIALTLSSSLATADHSEPTPEPSALMDVIVVTATQDRGVSMIETDIGLEDTPNLSADATSLMTRIPGGARVGNGEITGQMQYRGLFGDRINLSVDGQRFEPGGPNLMDPPLSYAPMPLLQSIQVDRGVSPVSAGPGLAGGANAQLKRVDFTDSNDFSVSTDATTSGRTINDSYAVGGVLGVANNQFRANVIGAHERGDDMEFRDGTIGGTEFRRSVYGLSTGVRNDNQALGLTYRRHETGPSGTPAVGSDIRFIDSDFVNADYDAQIGGYGLRLSYQYADVDHEMSNFEMRTDPGAMMRREIKALATTHGGEAALDFAAFGGTLTLGGDAFHTSHDVTVRNPSNPDFFATAFPDVEMRRYGGFGEWLGGMGLVEGQLGVRVDHHRYSAGTAQVGAAGPMPMLANAFNAADRSGEKTTVDGVARLWSEVADGLTLRGTLASKTRMPNYVERFGWLPIAASAGLADGNAYIGDLNLNPERAWIIEGGFDWVSSTAYARPTVFLRRIDDYIQGTRTGTTNMMGQDILRWTNVDARLYGIDFDAGYDFAGPLRLDAIASYVRGQRRDIDDNLYRVAPPSLTAGLTWEASVWSATFETYAAAAQNRVSVTNDEEKTPGFVTLNLYGEWTPAAGVSVMAGVENLTNKLYRQHLAGYNQNTDSDVELNQRLPGAGRGGFLRVNFSY